MLKSLMLEILADGTVSKAFRIVRDNRVNSNMNVEMKTASLQCPSSHSDQIAPNMSERGYAYPIMHFLLSSL